MSVRPVKTQISLGIRPVWSESSLSAWRKLGSLATHWAHSEDSDQTGRMPRLIWVFTGRTVTLLVLTCRGSFNPCWNVPKPLLIESVTQKDTVKILKIRTPQKNAVITLKFENSCFTMCPNDADVMTKQCRAWSDCSSVWSGLHSLPRPVCLKT